VTFKKQTKLQANKTVKNNRNVIRLEVFRLGLLKIQIFWDIKLCLWLKSSHCFKGFLEKGKINRIIKIKISSIISLFYPHRQPNNFLSFVNPSFLQQDRNVDKTTKLLLKQNVGCYMTADGKQGKGNKLC
jgi:hypothetical protein